MLLDKKTYVVKERVALVKLTDSYDILDAVTAQPIGMAREEPPAWAKWIRLVMNKKHLPTAINVYEGSGTTPILTIHRGFTLLRAKVSVSAGDRLIGSFRAKLISIGGAFTMLDAQDQEIGLVKGDWKGWNFQMTTPTGENLGSVTKKWAGLGKELFTSADTYAITISDAAAQRPDVPALLLAAGLAIDTIYKESE